MPAHRSVSAVLVRPLAAALEAAPASLAAFFEATELTPQLVADPEARVSPAQFRRAWAQAVRESADPGLALRIAEATPPGAFGVVEYVCRSSATLRLALEQWVRYLGILDNAVAVGLVDSGDVTALRVLAESEEAPPQSHELCFALVVRRARALLQSPLGLTEVRFAHRTAERSPDRYREFFGCPVRFGADHTELLFQRASLDSPLSTADPQLASLLVPTAEQKVDRSPAPLPTTDRVRRALRAALSTDEAQLESVARRFGMTPRSLQRRLKDEGTSFQSVREEMRRELAERYLGQGMSSAEISFMLGFSEPSAFFRAFKRWTGLTPLEHRQVLGR